MTGRPTPIAHTIRYHLSKPRTVAILGAVALLLLMTFFGSALVARAQKTYGYDFVALYVSGARYFEGNDVYGTVPLNVLGPIAEDIPKPDRDMHPNLNPPFAVLLLAPLSRLPFANAYLSWSLISFLCAIAAAWLLAAAFATPQNQFSLSIGLLVLLLAYPPTWIGFALGQTAMPVFLLLAAGWCLARNGNERGAGAVLGVTLAIKPFVGVLLIYFLALRRWRLIAWSGCGFAMANLIALAFMGPGVFIRYVEVLRTVTWRDHEMNASLFGLLARLSKLAASPSMQEIAQWTPIVGYACSLLLLASLVLLSRRLPQWPSRQGIDIGYAYCLVLMLLISPLGWVYYFPNLLICILIILSVSGNHAAPWLFRLAAGTIWIGSGAMKFFLAEKPHTGTLQSMLDVSNLFTGILVMTAATLWILARDAALKSQAVTATR